MPNNMDYALVHRTPDGTGKILVTTPATPDKGSWESESELKTYVNQDMVAIADIVDDLVTADPAKTLSANQGVVLKQLIDAFSGGIVPKGDILSSNLPAASASNKGWQYYCTDLNKYATSDGTQWIMTSNNVITQTPDATDTGHALSNAVVTQCCNEVNGKLNQHESRLENLEQKAGDYTTVQYRGTNAVPTGKAKYGLVKSIVGKTRAWNQLCSTTSFPSTTTHGVTFSIVDGILSVANTSDAGVWTGLATINIIANHKYLVLGRYLGLYKGSLSFSVGNNFAGIYSATEDMSSVSYQFMMGSGVTTNYSTPIGVYDLTLIFGAGNEPSTVADALAQLPALGQYNAYDAGSLPSTVVSGVKSVGVNLWDEVPYNHGGVLESQNAIRVTPGVSYQFLYAGNASQYPTVTLYWLDKDGNEVSRTVISANFPTPATASPFQCPMGAVQLIFAVSEAQVGTMYNHDIQICLYSLPVAIRTIYHPYKTDTLSLPETVTLRSAGSVAEVLDVESGRVTHPVKEVATYNWSYSDNGYWMSDVISDINANDGTTKANIICNKYAVVSAVDLVTSSTLIGVAQASSGRLLCRNGSSDTPPSIIVYYELATPTTESIDPVTDNFIETEGGGTVETIQTQTPVIDNCLDVGYLAL